MISRMTKATMTSISEMPSSPRRRATDRRVARWNVPTRPTGPGGRPIRARPPANPSIPVPAERDTVPGREGDVTVPAQVSIS